MVNWTGKRVRGNRKEYSVGNLFAHGDVTDLYRATIVRDGDPAIFKVAREPTVNDLLINESRILRLIIGKEERIDPYLPGLVDSFIVHSAEGDLQANVFLSNDGWYSLKEVKQIYPNGVSPRHAAWMFRKLLNPVGLAHREGILHGGVLPPHVLVNPALHGVQLIDWTASVLKPAQTGERLDIMPVEYINWYPPETYDRDGPKQSVDITMAARCIVYVLGGNPLTAEIPVNPEYEDPWVYEKFQAFFAGTVLPEMVAPKDAWALRTEFTSMIDSIWRKEFVPFQMPR